MERYIDAEKLSQDIRLRYCKDCNNHNEVKCKACEIEDMLDEIEDAPSADVVEVNHGEWIDKWGGKYANPTYICSICGEKALLECYINELEQWRYRQSLSICCPHCGAKMDGGCK